MVNDKVINIPVSELLWEALKLKAVAERTSMSQWIREVLMEKLVEDRQSKG